MSVFTLAIHADGSTFTVPITITPTGPSPARFQRISYTYAPQPAGETLTQEAQRYQSMWMQSTDGKNAAALKAANPALKVFLYMDSLLTGGGDTAGWRAPLTVSQIDPSWYLLDQNGAKITPKAYPGYSVMDIGSPGFQQAAAAHIAAIALGKGAPTTFAGWDGIILDDLTAWVGWVFPTGIISPKYPTPAAWQAATTGFLAALVPAVKALTGGLVCGNIGGAQTTPGLWRSYQQYLDGAVEESWTDAGAGPSSSGAATWQAQQANAAWSETNGKRAILHSWSTTAANNLFGLCSMLLVANGMCEYSVSNPGQAYHGTAQWLPEYDQAIALGAALGPATQSGGLHSRPFEGGTVYVNPTSSAVGTLAAWSAAIQ